MSISTNKEMEEVGEGATNGRDALMPQSFPSQLDKAAQLGHQDICVR